MEKFAEDWLNENTVLRAAGKGGRKKKPPDLSTTLTRAMDKSGGLDKGCWITQQEPAFYLLAPDVLSDASQKSH